MDEIVEPSTIYHILSNSPQSRIDKHIKRIYSEFIDEQNWIVDKSRSMNEDVDSMFEHQQNVKKLLVSLKEAQILEAKTILESYTYRKSPFHLRSKRKFQLRDKHVKEKYYIEDKLANNEILRGLGSIVDAISIKDYDKLYDIIERDLTIYKILGDTKDYDATELEKQLKRFSYFNQNTSKNLAKKSDLELEEIYFDYLKKYIDICNKVQEKYATNLLASEVYLTSPLKIQKLIDDFLFERQTQQQKQLSEFFSNKENTIIDINEYSVPINMFIEDYKKLYENIKNTFLEDGDQVEKEYKLNLIEETKANEKEKEKILKQEKETMEKVREEKFKIRAAELASSAINEYEKEFLQMYDQFLDRQKFLASDYENFPTLEEINKAQMKLLSIFLNEFTAKQKLNAKTIFASPVYQSGSQIEKNNIKHTMNHGQNAIKTEIEYNLLQSIFFVNKDQVRSAFKEHLIEDYDDMYTELEFDIIMENIMEGSNNDDIRKLKFEIDKNNNTVDELTKTIIGSDLKKTIVHKTDQFLKNCLNIQKEYALKIFSSNYYLTMNEELEIRMDEYLFRRQTKQIKMLRKYLRERNLLLDTESHNQLVQNLIIDLKEFYKKLKDEVLHYGTAEEVARKEILVRKKDLDRIARIQEQELDRLYELNKQDPTIFRIPLLENHKQKTELDHMLHNYNLKILKCEDDIKVQELKLTEIPGLVEKIKEDLSFNLANIFDAIKSQKSNENFLDYVSAYEQIFANKLLIDYFNALRNNIIAEQEMENIRLSLMEPETYKSEKEKFLNEKRVKYLVAEYSRKKFINEFLDNHKTLVGDTAHFEMEMYVDSVDNAYRDLVMNQIEKFKNYEISIEAKPLEDDQVARQKEERSKVAEQFRKIRFITTQLELQPPKRMRYYELDDSAHDPKRLNEIDKNTNFYLNKLDEILKHMNISYAKINELQNHKHIEEIYNNMLSEIYKLENRLKNSQDLRKIEMDKHKLNNCKEKLKNIKQFLFSLPKNILKRAKDLLILKYEFSAYETLYENVIGCNPTDKQAYNKKILEDINRRRMVLLNFSKEQLQRAIDKFQEQSDMEIIDINIDNELDQQLVYFTKLTERQNNNLQLAGFQKPVLKEIIFSPIKASNVMPPLDMSTIEEESISKVKEKDEEMINICKLLIKSSVLYPNIIAKFHEMIDTHKEILHSLYIKTKMLTNNINNFENDLKGITNNDRKTQLLNKINGLKSDLSKNRSEILETELNILQSIISLTNYLQLDANIKFYTFLSQRPSNIEKLTDDFEKGNSKRVKLLNNYYENTISRYKQNGDDILLKIANEKIIQLKEIYSERIQRQIAVLNNISIKELTNSNIKNLVDVDVEICIQRLEIYPKILRALENVIVIKQSVLKDQFDLLIKTEITTETEESFILKDEALLNLTAIRHKLDIVKSKKEYYCKFKKSLRAIFSYEPTKTEALYDFIENENFHCLLHNISTMREYLKLFFTTEQILEVDNSNKLYYEELSNSAKIDLEKLLKSRSLIKNKNKLIKLIYDTETKIIKSEICNLLYWKYMEFPQMLDKSIQSEVKLKETLKKTSNRDKEQRNNLEFELLLLYYDVKGHTDVYIKLTEILKLKDVNRSISVNFDFMSHIRNKIEKLLNYLTEHYEHDFNEFVGIAANDSLYRKAMYEQIKEICLKQNIKIDKIDIQEASDNTMELMDNYIKNTSANIDSITCDEIYDTAPAIINQAIYVSKFFDKEFNEIYNYGDKPIQTVNKLRELILSYHCRIEDYDKHLKNLKSKENTLLQRFKEYNDKEEDAVQNAFDLFAFYNDIEEIKFNKYVLVLLNNFDEYQSLGDQFHIKTRELLDSSIKDVGLYNRDLLAKIDILHKDVTDIFKDNSIGDQCFSVLENLDRKFRSLPNYKKKLIKVLNEVNDAKKSNKLEVSYTEGAVSNENKQDSKVNIDHDLTEISTQIQAQHEEVAEGHLISFDNVSTTNITAFAAESPQIHQINESPRTSFVNATQSGAVNMVSTTNLPTAAVTLPLTQQNRTSIATAADVPVSNAFATTAVLSNPLIGTSPHTKITASGHSPTNKNLEFLREIEDILIIKKSKIMEKIKQDTIEIPSNKPYSPKAISTNKRHLDESLLNASSTAISSTASDILVLNTIRTLQSTCKNLESRSEQQNSREKEITHSDPSDFTKKTTSHTPATKLANIATTSNATTSHTTTISTSPRTQTATTSHNTTDFSPHTSTGAKVRTTASALHNTPVVTIVKTSTASAAVTSSNPTSTSSHATTTSSTIPQNPVVTIVQNPFATTPTSDNMQASKFNAPDTSRRNVITAAKTTLDTTSQIPETTSAHIGSSLTSEDKTPPKIYGLSQIPGIITPIKTPKPELRSVNDKSLPIERSSMTPWLKHQIYGSPKDLDKSISVSLVESSSEEIVTEESVTQRDTEHDERIMLDIIIENHNIIINMANQFNHNLYKAEDQGDVMLAEKLAADFGQQLHKVQKDRLQKLKSSEEYIKSSSNQKSRIDAILEKLLKDEDNLIVEIVLEHQRYNSIKENEELDQSIESTSLTSTDESLCCYNGLSTSTFESTIEESLDESRDKFRVGDWINKGSEQIASNRILNITPMTRIPNQVDKTVNNPLPVVANRVKKRYPK